MAEVPVKEYTLRSSSDITAPGTHYGTSYETQRSAGTTTGTTSNKLVDSTATFTTDGVSVGDIIHNTTDDTFALVTAIDSATTLSIGTDIMASGEDYVIYTNIGQKINDIYETVVAILDVTSAETDAGDTLNVYIDTSFDNGEKWINIGAFTQLLGNGGAKRYLMSFKANPVASSNSVDATANQTAGNALQIGFGQRFRYRGIGVETGTFAYTYELKLLFRK